MTQKYKLLLPKTKFPLRTNHAVSDPRIRSAANFEQLYRWQLDNRTPDGPTFTLHDGPPYANGSPHMGHALNKILKDILNRYKLLRGFRVQYRPGWDCHGLPIELKACQNQNADLAKTVSAMDVRNRAAEFARSVLNQQREAFKSWGCFGDWEDPYLTMSPDYEACQIGVFHEMFKRGCVYRGFKPVYWSPSSRTALAEAELEYRDHVSRSAYVLYPLLESSDPPNIGGVAMGEVSALVWTTTPWTLPANKAICYHPDHTYSLVRLKTAGKMVLIGAKCLEKLSPILGEYEVVVSSVPGACLGGVQYASPLDRSCKPRPFLPAGHVGAEEGTGLVHTAPAHGHDDYTIGLRHDLDLTCTVDDRGQYSKEEEEWAGLQGLSVLDEGNEAVCAALRGAGALLHEHPHAHRYPYDWRSKRPVILRATRQWFASVRSLRARAVEVLTSDVDTHPPSAKNRLLRMLEGRDDWCISRQRCWGVPLPIFYHRATDKPLITDNTVSHIRDLIGRHGTDCWWTLSTRELLPESLWPVSEDYARGEDTMDVWFDSGSSWASVLRGGMADVYLEGSDQHRGWFQSSLLTSVAVRSIAPYRTVVTHGFVLDKSGDKMSKSAGNVTSPEDILGAKGMGADAMRLWVASGDYFRDVQLSDEVLRQNADLLQKVRNTCRFMLANLGDFAPARHLLPYSDLSRLDRYLLHLLREFCLGAVTSYDSFEFSGVCHALAIFVPNELSSFYFDVVKDRLYCEEGEGHGRRAVQTTLYHILEAFVHSVAPILPHLAEEVAQYAPMQESVFRSTWQDCPSEWSQPHLAEQFQLLRSLVSLSHVALEKARIAKTIRSSLEARVDIHTDSDAVKSTLSELTASQAETNIEFSLCDYLIVSEATIQGLGEATIQRKDTFVEEGVVKCGGEEVKVSAVAAPVWGRGKCPRCWKWVCAEGEELCGRCARVEGQS